MSADAAGGRKVAKQRVMAAVIELGTTSIRMTAAHRHGKKRYDTLDTLQQSVTLGRDTFTQGFISGETTEKCVSAIRSFRRVLAEYGITRPEQITAIASSAVREAANRDDFLDRILIATGVDVRIIDQAEVNRFTYLAVRPAIAQMRRLKKGTTAVLEVGGGSTEVLVFRSGRVASAHLYPLGSMRVRRMLIDYRAPRARMADILREHVERTVYSILQTLGSGDEVMVLVLGNDARFACTVIAPEWDRKRPARIKVSDLAGLTDKILSLSVDEIVKRYALTYPDAETLGPALFVYAELAKALRLKQIMVGGMSLRDGVLAEVAASGSWTSDFKHQIVNSALEIARRYGVELDHAKRTARIADELFVALQEEHGLGMRQEIILQVACLLHDVGHFISRSSHHKHSQYLISNSEIFGLSAADCRLVALVARYHRRGMPKATHPFYASLDRDDRIVVGKLAAILRIADVLARPRIQFEGKLKVRLEPGALQIAVQPTGDIILEQHAVRERGNLVERIYGRKVVLRTVSEGV